MRTAEITRNQQEKVQNSPKAQPWGCGQWEDRGVRICEEGQDGTGQRGRQTKRFQDLCYMQKEKSLASEIAERADRKQDKRATGLGALLVWWGRNQCDKKLERER